MTDVSSLSAELDVANTLLQFTRDSLTHKMHFHVGRTSWEFEDNGMQYMRNGNRMTIEFEKSMYEIMIGEYGIADVLISIMKLHAQIIDSIANRMTLS